MRKQSLYERHPSLDCNTGHKIRASTTPSLDGQTYAPYDDEGLASLELIELMEKREPPVVRAGRGSAAMALHDHLPPIIDSLQYRAMDQ